MAEQETILFKLQGKEKLIPIDTLPITIGRYSENILVLAYDDVSGVHGRISCENGRLYYEDLDSTNGTYVGPDHNSLTLLRNARAILDSAGILVFGEEENAEIAYRIQMNDGPGKDDFRRIFANGYAFLKDKDYANALECFENMLEHFSHRPTPYYYAGIAASHLDRLDKAISRLEQYLTLRPNDSHGQLDLGKLYERKGQLKRAGSCYQRALALDPKNPDILDRIKDLRRYGPVSASNQESRSTVDIIGFDLRNTVKTRHFVVDYNVALHGRRLNDVLKTLEDAYIGVGKHLGIYPKGQAKIVLCNDSVGETQGIYDAVGLYSKECIKVALSSTTISDTLLLRIVLIHEYLHFLVTSILSPETFVPWWFHEGIAQYESQGLGVNAECIIAELSALDSLIPLEVLEKGMSGQPKELVQAAYAQAHSLVEYLVERCQWEGMRTLIRGLASGNSFEEAIRAIMADYESLEQNWQVWLENKLRPERKDKTKQIR